jgi:hypothetical protein
MLGNADLREYYRKASSERYDDFDESVITGQIIDLIEQQ